MARLIDADALYAEITGSDNKHADQLMWEWYANMVERQPTIDPVKQEWINVKDRLPKQEDDVIILVREIEHYGRHKEKRNVYHWIYTGWFVDGVWATTYCHGYKEIETENEEYPNCEHAVTHWMPLPELPWKSTEI